MNINLMNTIIQDTVASKRSVSTDYQVLFNDARKEGTPSAFIEYTAQLSKESDAVISKNINTLLDRPETIRFLKFFANSNYLTIDDLCVINKEIEQRIHSVTDADTTYLTEAKERIDNIIAMKSTMKWLNADVKYNFACSRYASACVYESSIVDDLDIIRYSINTSPDAINQFAKVLQKIDMEPFAKVEQSFPQILTRTTEIIFGLDVVISGQSMKLLTSVPRVLSNRLVSDGSVKQKRAFINIIDKQVYEMRNYIKHVDPRQYDIVKSYLDELYAAKADIENHMNDVTVKEHIADMQPDVIMYEDGVIEDPCAELEELLTDIIFDDNDELDKPKLESLVRLSNIINHEYTVTESGRVVRFVGETTYAKSSKNGNNKGESPFIRNVNAYIAKCQKNAHNERVGRLLHNNYKQKLMSYLTISIQGLVMATVYGCTLGPMTAVASIAGTISGLLVSIVIDTNADDKVRLEIGSGFERELAKVNKKLNSMKDGENNQQKRQLLRVKKNLEKNIERTKMLQREQGSRASTESFDNTELNSIVCEDYTGDDIYVELESLLSDIIFGDDVNDTKLESLFRLGDNINDNYIVIESGGVSKVVRKGAYKASDKSRNLASKVDKARADADRTKTAIKKGIDPFVSMVNKYLNQLKDSDREQRRQRIITGEYKFKLIKFLKRLIGAIGTGAFVMGTSGIAPILAIIGYLSSIAIDKHVDDKVRREIIRELETELSVVNEKLEDSRGDENKQNKYQLIRIKKKLESDLERVRFEISKKEVRNPIKTSNG